MSNLVAKYQNELQELRKLGSLENKVNHTMLAITWPYPEATENASLLSSTDPKVVDLKPSSSRKDLAIAIEDVEPIEDITQKVFEGLDRILQTFGRIAETMGVLLPKSPTATTGSGSTWLDPDPVVAFKLEVRMQRKDEILNLLNEARSDGATNQAEHPKHRRAMALAATRNTYELRSALIENGYVKEAGSLLAAEDVKVQKTLISWCIEEERHDVAVELLFQLHPWTSRNVIVECCKELVDAGEEQTVLDIIKKLPLDDRSIIKLSEKCEGNGSGFAVELLCCLRGGLFPAELLASFQELDKKWADTSPIKELFKWPSEKQPRVGVQTMYWMPSPNIQLPTTGRVLVRLAAVCLDLLTSGLIDLALPFLEMLEIENFSKIIEDLAQVSTEDEIIQLLNDEKIKTIERSTEVSKCVEDLVKAVEKNSSEIKPKVIEAKYCLLLRRSPQEILKLCKNLIRAKKPALVLEFSLGLDPNYMTQLVQSSVDAKNYKLAIDLLRKIDVEKLSLNDTSIVKLVDQCIYDDRDLAIELLFYLRKGAFPSELLKTWEEINNIQEEEASSELKELFLKSPKDQLRESLKLMCQLKPISKDEELGNLFKSQALGYFADRISVLCINLWANDLIALALPLISTLKIEDLSSIIQTLDQRGEITLSAEHASALLKGRIPEEVRSLCKGLIEANRPALVLEFSRDLTPLDKIALAKAGVKAKNYSLAVDLVKEVKVDLFTRDALDVYDGFLSLYKAFIKENAHKDLARLISLPSHGQLLKCLVQYLISQKRWDDFSSVIVPMANYLNLGLSECKALIQGKQMPLALPFIAKLPRADIEKLCTDLCFKCKRQDVVDVLTALDAHAYQDLIFDTCQEFLSKASYEQVMALFEKVEDPKKKIDLIASAISAEQVLFANEMKKRVDFGGFQPELKQLCKQLIEARLRMQHHKTMFLSGWILELEQESDREELTQLKRANRPPPEDTGKLQQEIRDLLLTQDEILVNCKELVDNQNSEKLQKLYLRLSEENKLEIRRYAEESSAEEGLLEKLLTEVSL